MAYLLNTKWSSWKIKMHCWRSRNSFEVTIWSQSTFSKKRWNLSVWFEKITDQPMIFYLPKSISFSKINQTQNFDTELFFIKNHSEKPGSNLITTIINHWLSVDILLHFRLWILTQAYSFGSWHKHIRDGRLDRSNILETAAIPIISIIPPEW